MADETPPSPDSSQPIINVAAPYVTVQPQITVQPAEVNNLTTENSEARTANRISSLNLVTTIVGIIINAALFGITLYTFYQTKRSVDISEQSLNHSIENDRLSEERKRSDDKIAEIRYQETQTTSLKKGRQDSITLSLAQQSVRSQIRSLEQTQRNFGLENEPFIEIENVTITSEPTIGKNFYIQYELDNLKNIPVFILSELTYMVYSYTDSVSVNKKFQDTDFVPLNKYLIKESQVIKGSAANIDDNLMKLFREDKDLHLYYIKLFKYKDLISGKIRIYKAVVKLKYIFGNTMVQNRTQAEFILTGNYDFN